MRSFKVQDQLNMNCLKACGPNRILRNSSLRWTSTVLSDNQDALPSPTSSSVLPEEPTTCCMSGCANCVWIEYAEQLSKMFDGGGQKTRDIVLSKVSDPNMKAFLLMELKALDQIKNKGGTS